MTKGILSIIIIIVFLLACEDKNIKNTNLNNKITILTPNFDKAITAPIREKAKEFEKNTNSTIRILSPSWDEMLNKIEESLEDKQINYDIFVIFSSWAGSILAKENAQEIPQWVKDKIKWNDILPIYKNNVLSWNHKYYFLPYDGDNLIIYYRKDLLENKEYQKKFKEAFGYQLDVPKTWAQYKDIAKFFNGWDWDNDGKIEYGVAESRIKGYGTLLQFFTKAAAYAKHPDDKTYYFDENMNPKINNQGFIKALENFIDLMKYAPPQIKNFSPAEVRQSFIAGDVALALDWADIGPMAQNSKESSVKNLVGYAPLPGSNTVFNSKKNIWESIYNHPSSISGNWIFVINKNSKNKKLAFDFASLMTSQETTKQLITIGSTGINPSRYSHLKTDDLKEWEKNGFEKNSAKKYIETISKSLSNKNLIFDLRIPGSNRYYEVFDKYLNEAILKQLSPKEALDKTAKEWNKITKEIGLDKQIKANLESINE